MKHLRLVASCATAAAACWAGTPLSADASAYDVQVCRGGPASAAAFQTLNSALSSVTCPPLAGSTFSGLVATDQLGSGDYLPGQRGGFTVSAPVGTTITRIAARRYFGKRDVAWSVAVRSAQGLILETCTYDPATTDSCSLGVGSDPQHATNSVVYSQLGTSSVDFGFVCEPTSASACGQDLVQHQVWMVIYDATVTIEDPVGPVLGPATGALFGSGGSGGWHKGVESAGVGASDASGIARTAVKVGGSSYGVVGQACDYTQVRPCPGSVSTMHAVDLGQIADGVHELRVSATDAAGQETLSAPVALKVDGHAPSSPQGLTAALGADGSWRLSWAESPQAGGAPVVAARYALCRAASADCPVEGRSAGAGDVVVATPTGEPWDALVWLEDEAGNEDRVTAARVALIAPVVPPPPVATPKRPAGLRISALRRRAARFRVSGTIAPTSTGTVTLRVRARRGGPVVARGSGRVRRGRWAVSARLARAFVSTRWRLVTASYGGDRRHVAQTITRRVRR